MWNVLEKAKKDFSSFEKVIEDIRNRLNKVDEDFEKLIGTRTRAINKSLKNVKLLSEDKAELYTEADDSEDDE